MIATTIITSIRVNPRPGRCLPFIPALPVGGCVKPERITRLSGLLSPKDKSKTHSTRRQSGVRQAPMPLALAG
jgi:hypothetical protein